MIARATPTVFLNGRFLVQSLSGVQRFATEMTRALAVRWPDRLPRPVLLMPGKGEIDAAGSGGLEMRRVGRLGGPPWEQFELPRAAAGGLLVNFGNTAPLLPLVSGRRQIVVIHDAGVFSTPHSYSRPFRIYYKLLHRALTLGRTRIVTVSHFARGDIARHLRIAPERIGLVTEGADHATRVAADEGALRRHGLARGGYVLAVGNNAPHKDFPALGDLAATLAGQGRKLVISGGVDRRVFSNAGQGGEAGLATAIYVGRVSDGELRGLYENAACFVFPSIYEGFGLPPVEAMACGCPVVARDIPVLREICGEAALYGATPAQLTARVLEILDDPARAAALREAGRRQAALYRWERAADQFLDIIQQELRHA
ncbi:glycosyltransferase family 4 protein [Acidomonas methanolica]|uniref:Glycosyl transferase n=1 Tax=Acidomonas methanolica NBRC 104435 TaxID=1231351 RepID=A0A023DA05_ACIMT|nr:glycosyltransferase family 1 protein [Acidomonas methanolica]MBU2655415.1 glycosyltransferase family 4 protein [Acidomonas methanolica]TCS23479.1 glycosyl transferase family 1 [Acidomonas methanolica]GAJ30540.1 glycosyl transferase [Acidomonas methanolica NBRC 104435]GBQ51704.1 glycosyltransferase [Acidomonas methanolica]GEL00281.1 group 1 glycosyl transferase [Acidomonas methanolica NBRC 104435]